MTAVVVVWCRSVSVVHREKEKDDEPPLEEERKKEVHGVEGGDV